MNRENLWQRWMAIWNRLAHPVQVTLLAVMDVALIGIGLCIFALFHHVLPQTEESLGVMSSRDAMRPAAVESVTTAAPQPVATAEPSPEGDVAAAPQVASATVEPVATPDPVGYFGTKFADKFTSGDIIDTVDANGNAVYQSGNLNITGTKYEQTNLVYYVIDIYVRDIACLKTAFANDKFGRGQRDSTATIASENAAIAAINGDYYSARAEGTVIRNGELYRDSDFGDVCVIYWDGTMETYEAKDFDAKTAMANGAYQAWNFGPMLLDENGQTMTEFNSSVTSRNPRTVIGYYEPGHYCFVAVDGRSDKSKGLTMAQLSELMYSLGCKRAYNLDGGQTSEMIWKGKVINEPYKGGRECSDIVLVAEP